MIDLKQAASVAILALAAIGLWFAGAKLGMPTEYTSPAIVALTAAVVGAAKSYVRPSSSPPSKVPPLPVFSVFLLALLATGCKDPQTANDVIHAALTLEQEACVLAEDELGSGTPDAIAAICQVPPSLIQQVIDLIGARKAAAARVKAKR